MLLTVELIEEKWKKKKGESESGRNESLPLSLIISNPLMTLPTKLWTRLVLVALALMNLNYLFLSFKFEMVQREFYLLSGISNE